MLEQLQGIQFIVNPWADVAMSEDHTNQALLFRLLLKGTGFHVMMAASVDQAVGNEDQALWHMIEPFAKVLTRAGKVCPTQGIKGVLTKKIIASAVY